MKDTKFRKALRRVMSQELYESQSDEERKMQMLVIIAEAHGYAMTFAFNGDQDAIKQYASTCNRVIEAFSIDAIEGYSSLGSRVH